MTIEVSDVRDLPCFFRDPWLAARAGIVATMDEPADHLAPGEPVLLAGEPLGGTRWHAAAAVRARGDDTDLAGIVLTAHALHLLRRAGARGGDSIARSPAVRAPGLDRLVDRYGLRVTDDRARLVFWTGGEHSGLDPGATALWLAGPPPRGLRTVLGPITPIHARAVEAPAQVRWPFSRSLATAARLVLGEAAS